MSAGNVINPPRASYDAFYVAKASSGRFAVCDRRGCWVWANSNAVDIYRTRSGAEHFARLLNSGLAGIDPHAVLGCKVVANGGQS